MDFDYYSVIQPKLAPYLHQRRAVNELIEGVKTYGYHALFMEMGTGKTKTTIDAWQILLHSGAYDGLVVVAPKAILSVWEIEEIPRHMFQSYALYRWDGRTSAKSQKEFGAVLDSQLPAVFIVNIESFQTVPEAMRLRLRAFLQKRKCLMAVDESSYIKSPDAKRSKNIKAAGMLAKARVILTGTEITNSPLDLYMQFEFLCPGFWKVKNYFIFRMRYAILKEEYGPGRRTFKKVVGFQRINELMDRIAPFCSRALKRECLDLPGKIYTTIYVELSDAQKQVYKQLKEFLAAMVRDKIVTVPNKIALFTKFRQIPGGCINIEGESAIIDDDPPKLQALLSDLADTDEQAIIWCAFTHEIELVSKALSKIANTATFYGEGSQDARNSNMRLFQEGAVRFLVGNPAAGAYGLNLQNCHLQYNYSRVLSPSQSWQAEDRIHRPGQQLPCVYKTIIAQGTVDERIESLLAQKTDIRTRFQDMSIADMYDLV